MAVFAQMTASAKGGRPTPRFAPREVLAHYTADGVITLRACVALDDVPDNIAHYLERNALSDPERVFLGQRAGPDRWDTVTYAAAWYRVQSIAQRLVDLKLTPDHPIVILSPASIEHGLLMPAGMLVGIPVAPVSPTCSLLPEARPRLVEIADLVKPGLVFVQTQEAFAAVRDLPALRAARWVSARGGAGSESIADWYAVATGPELDARRAAVTPETIGKTLFTSGSTGSPKGVINTQRMLCSAVCAAGVLTDPAGPPIQVDWMPWHHTMGGNTVLHGTLRNRGSLYIDDGRPTPAMFARTLSNLRDMPPTTMMSVPAAYALLVTALERDDDLRVAFFSRLEQLLYAGASLPQDIGDRMQVLAHRTIGQAIPFGSGYGTTETGPGITVTHWSSAGRGEIGLPAAGTEIRLVPCGVHYEVRVRGPNVTPGYYKRPDLTAAAFDEDGFYRVGDLVDLADPRNPAARLRFCGRLSESFKLSNGSWVATGDLRLAILEACSPYAADVVLAGVDRDDVRVMIWAAQSTDGQDVERYLYERLTAHNARGGGPTHRVAAFHVLDEPQSIGSGETTDKGYVNQHAVLQRRADIVDDLYVATPGVRVVLLDRQGVSS